ncbi:MAG: amidohydrolase family protein [Cyclobacteriaceae bacterium]
MLISTFGFSQVPAPGSPQSEPIAILNAFAHLGNGEVIANSIITFKEGKIENVVDATTSRLDLTSYKKIDAKGKHVYPGLILLMSEVGLLEIEAVRASNDMREVGNIKPHVRSAIAYNTDSEVIPTLKFNGVQIMQVVPKGGRIPGTSSIMQLDAWNWEDALYLEDDAVHLNWPSKTRGAKANTKEVGRQNNEKFQKQKQEVLDLIADTRAYMSANAESTNLILEAMAGIVSGSQQLFVKVNRAEDIIDAVQTLSELNIPKVVMVGVRDIWQVKDLIKESGYPVVLENTHRLPGRIDEDIDWPYRLPSLVHNEGIPLCLSHLTSHMFSSARNLPFLAGTAAAYGLDKEVALSLITLEAAKVLGIDQKTGSLEEGKDANIVISEGDILDPRTSIVTHSFIQGREVDLNALQQRLYEKFKTKYSE